MPGKTGPLSNLGVKATISGTLPNSYQSLHMFALSFMTDIWDSFDRLVQELSSIYLCLISERNWNLWIPGFGSEELRPYKKVATTEAHKQVF